ncbi:MAG: N-methylhydantoinase A/oxoprolinase/acetone carboxylase beta subunit [Granulosicoccus sp.]
MGYQLGLDTGGTYTDAVLVDDDLNVLASAKSLTTHNDLIEGLRGAVEGLQTDVELSDISLVSLSTTLATNALVEGRGRTVALVLVGFTPSQMKRANLTEALAGDPHVFIDGGHNASGHAVCEPDVIACRDFVERVDGRVDAYAISSVFAVRNPAHEIQVQKLITEMTGKPVTCGHHLTSGLDAPRRALTALLNARLIPMIGSLLDAARSLLIEHGIDAPLMVVKGDGSLISDEMATKYPVETILSGPAASVVGAQFLCKQPTLLVSDMGGTTTDVALIRDSQPRLNPAGATVGGWRTMVQAVDVRTYGLGGDSAIRFDREAHVFTAGPQRVMPLSLLTKQHPELITVLEAQLQLPYSTTHSGQFVMTHGPEPSDLSLQQRELYDRICEGPIAVQTLFSDQTLDRALQKLEQKGVVLRSGFTPSDAAHVLFLQTDWETCGAELGAELLMRYSASNLGNTYASRDSFAESIMTLISQETAMVLLDTVAACGGQAEALSVSQKALIRRTLGRTSSSLFSLAAQLKVPVVGLGAPASSYYKATGEMLGAEIILPEYAHVANALGAVVGTIRQEQVISIAPAGGKRVSVLFPGGPKSFDDLESGALAAKQECEKLAKSKANAAGASEVTITYDRRDIAVKDGDQSVFFESRISALAVGRPASSI